MDTVIIDVGKDFSVAPAGRNLSDGPNSGERFRKDFLVPALKENRHILIKLDTAEGYGSSFLEEAFGGLVREEGFSAKLLSTLLDFETIDANLVPEIQQYILEAQSK
ncbi:STAS-like domain-containing protein [Kordiimonas marina]|uniref:STAS-like domain-containing protein n=1 Tax=Kordiimonas marina TaxID=2872312 RepID=UPI001FF571DE|nr:STAS-like domain-containing protein [Kordiimonas marina]MCJ9428156.1 STAS-like domain-containing protein [Kordiimonas marina]